MRSHRAEVGEKETGRVEAFSDGIFAFAITLLVLDLKVPADLDLRAHSGLIGALRAEWPSFLAYLISFGTILVMWMNHHKLFQIIHKIDQTLLILNGLLLLGVTVSPFTTSLLAEYIERPDAKIAAAVYSGTFVVIAFFFNILWNYSIKGNRLLREGHDHRQVRKITHLYIVGQVLYLVAFLSDFASVTACVAICAFLTIFFALPETLFHGKDGQSTRPRSD
ncbi:MAG TPA: TMEM175 family protein [Capsulimonadaceae bacterium]|nr:TMEM175 family protein [Capsulimonadaceae bacterium]